MTTEAISFLLGSGGAFYMQAAPKMLGNFSRLSFPLQNKENINTNTHSQTFSEIGPPRSPDFGSLN
jgi:hypothetical protein